MQELGSMLERKEQLDRNAPDQIIDRDPTVALNEFLATHRQWKRNSAHVYWKQEGYSHLDLKDYIVSSIQVWSRGLPVGAHSDFLSSRKQEHAGCMRLLSFSIYSS